MTDTERLDWLIRQGPLGATEGIGLTEEAWDAAIDISDAVEFNTDAKCIRAAIDAAMNYERMGIVDEIRDTAAEARGLE